MCVAGWLFATTSPSLAAPSAQSRFYRVGSVAIEGGQRAGLSEHRVLELDVELARTPAGWVGPRRGLRVQRVPLWALGKLGGQRARVDATALQSIVEAVARGYSDASRPGTRVDILGSDLRTLAAAGSDGVLVLHVRPGRGASPEPAVLVALRRIVFTGVSVEGLGADALGGLYVRLAQTDQGYTSPHPDLPDVSMTLAQLLSQQPEGVKLTTSALQEVLNAVGRGYEAIGMPGTRVRIRQDALDRIVARDADGVLEIEVAEAP